MTEEIYKPFELTKEEINSALWKKLHAHFSERLREVRESNDNSHNEVITSLLRGRIDAYKEFLRLNNIE